MSKNYPQRAQTAEKISTKLEMPGFNPVNVILDQETHSPRLLSSFEKSGMRPLKPYQKTMYAQYQQKNKKEAKQAALKQQQKLNKSIPSPDLSRFIQQKQETKKCVNLGGGAFTAKEKIAAMNRKNIFEENYYPSPYSIGRKREEAPKMEEREEREGREEKIKLDDSMTNSTLRMVEKLSDEREKKEEKERPGTGNEDKITYISNEVTTIRQQMMRQQQEKILLNELMKKLLQRLDNNIKPQSHQESPKTNRNQVILLKEQLRQTTTSLQASQGQKKKLAKSLQQIQSTYSALRAKSHDLEVVAQEQEAITEKITISLRECQAKLRQSETRCQHLEKKLISQKALPPRPKFCSQAIIENDLSSFLCTSIQEFSGRRVRRAKLIFQMDEWNTSITKYLDRPPFPLLLFMQSGQGNQFGAFLQGLQTVTGSIGSEGKPLRGLLFNGNAKTVFHSTGKGNAGSYFQNYLKLGNNQLSIKNHNLGRVSVVVGSIFGEKYFNIPRRSHLTGQNSEIVEIVTLEVFEVFFQ